MKLCMRLYAVIIAFMLTLTCFLADEPIISVSAETAEKYGTVNVSDSLRVRSGAGTSYSILGLLYPGDAVTVVGEAKASDGATWYKIIYDSGYGYVHSDYIIIYSSAGSDADFEAYLTAQKFPDSYKPALRRLHAQYPSWIFVASHTGLSWDTVIKNETDVGHSLIQNSSYPDAYKSMEEGAYNWSTGSYISFDSGGWVMATTELVEYCMDPRNWLTKNYIFQFESLHYSSSHTFSGVSKILSGSCMSGSYRTDVSDSSQFATYADAFVSAAKNGDVSAYLLATRAKQEQGSSGNMLFKGTTTNYVGYFNIFNINAYAHDGRTAITNGAIYAAGSGSYGRPWNTPYKSILGAARFLSAGYISKQQDTLYYQKFDVLDGGNGRYSHEYMTNIFAPSSEGYNMSKAYSDDMLNSAITFIIPVYTNMPASCPKPTSTGNNNNLIKSISVSGCTLTPTFKRYTTDYNIIVDSSVSSVTVSATAEDSSANLTGTGKKSLNYGDNTVKLVCTSTSGKAREYTLNIYRTPGTDTPSVTPDPSIDSTVYTVGDYITGVQPETSVDTFITKLAVSNGTVKVTAADKTSKTSGNIATGDIVNIYKGDSLYVSYPVCIKGDVNGDGKITSVDMLVVQRHILGLTVQKDATLKAADASGDGKITSVDMLYIQKHILRLLTITQ